MIIESKYEIGQSVYLKTDGDQLERLITGITVRQGNRLIYELSCDTKASDHYDFEFTLERDLVKTTS